jgi:hypothetical protein
MKISGIFFVMVCTLLMAAACSEEANYLLEGNITGLSDPVLYIESGVGEDVKQDTIFSKDGRFNYKSSSDSLRAILLFMKERSVWITVWAQNGQMVEISGDVENPELITFNGNETNDLLTCFRQSNRAVIEERNRTKSEARKEELTQILIQNAQAFIRNHPQSIASLVLIQDYLAESGDISVPTEALSLIESPAKESALYRRLQAAF